MAQIDHSIYFQQEAPDILGSYMKGLTMRELIDQRNLRQKQLQEQEALEKAYSAGMKIGPDGQITFDQNKIVAETSKVNPIKGFEAQETFRERDLARQEQQMKKAIERIDRTSRILGSAKDQQSWAQALKTAQDIGIDVSNEPKAFDPNYVQHLNARLLSAKDRVDIELKKRELAIKEKNLANSRPGAQPRSEFEKVSQKKSAEAFAKRQENAEKIPAAISLVDDALNAQIQYSQNTLFGTGPMATGFGLMKNFDEDLESLNAKLKAVNVKNMATTFAGMSKAVDSDAERRAWEGTQADIKNDDRTNIKILLGQKSILLKDRAEAEAQAQWVAQNGNLDRYVSPIDGRVKTMVDKNGQMFLVQKEMVKDAAKQGFKTVDEFAKEAAGRKSFNRQSTGVRPQTQQTSPQPAAQKSLQQLAAEELERRRRQRMSVQVSGGQ